MTMQVEIIFSSGAVEVDPTGQEGFQMAQEGMLLSSGAVIRTLAGGYAELGFDETDQNIVRVEANTTAVVLVQNNEKLQLLKGEVFAIIHQLPNGSSFEIRTPTAVVGARGTEWVTRFDNDTTDVEAYDDNPFVKMINENGQVSQDETIVQSGYATTVKRFGRPTAFKPIVEERRQRWHALRQEVQHRVETERIRRGRPQRNSPPRGQAKGVGQQNRKKENIERRGNGSQGNKKFFREKGLEKGNPSLKQKYEQKSKSALPIKNRNEPMPRGYHIPSQKMSSNPSAIPKTSGGVRSAR